ncbi:MAG: XRE family transcriptional regulator [Shackletoniella antarctica]|jgi:transcriptional regulator with XRE-family HTH domain|uniref:XRE family transcriptional regulator n=1 Tax=Shackletoniella antarctica TaxID=268115 RepID=A0A2W4VW79_9CYAN|nr:MAG: XRE family transcriptional regulator [Shackletoniella antarctica]
MSQEREPLKPVDLRKRAKLTQRKLAEALDVRQGTISDWERGLAVPHLPPSKLKRMMEELDCTIDELIEAYEPEPEPAH